MQIVFFNGPVTKTTEDIVGHVTSHARKNLLESSKRLQNLSFTQNNIFSLWFTRSKALFFKYFQEVHRKIEKTFWRASQFIRPLSEL